MNPVTLEFLTMQLETADALLAGRDRMTEPQDLPGRYGLVICAVDRVLAATQCIAVLAGGWAVWRHGYVGRITQDVDIALPADKIAEVQAVAAVSGFDILHPPAGRWPKMDHGETGVRVDILPEGARPGTAKRPAPTTIPHPVQMGAEGFRLRYIRPVSLVELKLAAGRTQDENDVVQLIQTNPDSVDEFRSHLAAVHADYVSAFNRLVQRADEESDN